MENEDLYVDFLDKQEVILPPDTYYFLYSSFKDILVRWEPIRDSGSFIAQSRTNKIYRMAIEPEESQMINDREFLKNTVKHFLKIIKRFQVIREQDQEQLEVFQLLYPELSKLSLMKIAIIYIESTLKRRCFDRRILKKIDLSQFALSHGVSLPINFDNDYILEYVEEDKETQTGWKTKVIITRISPQSTQHEYPIDSLIKILPLVLKREILELLLPLVNWENRMDLHREEVTSLSCNINTITQQAHKPVSYIPLRNGLYCPECHTLRIHFSTPLEGYFPDNIFGTFSYEMKQHFVIPIGFKEEGKNFQSLVGIQELKDFTFEDLITRITSNMERKIPKLIDKNVEIVIHKERVTLATRLMPYLPSLKIYSIQLNGILSQQLQAEHEKRVEEKNYFDYSYWRWEEMDEPWIQMSQGFTQEQMKKYRARYKEEEG
ncbi:MAG: hypothetical protein ACW98F_14025 [Candidatus Hodarchaeales archaeon]